MCAPLAGSDWLIHLEASCHYRDTMGSDTTGHAALAPEDGYKMKIVFKMLLYFLYNDKKEYNSSISNSSNSVGWSKSALSCMGLTGGTSTSASCHSAPESPQRSMFQGKTHAESCGRVLHKCTDWSGELTLPPLPSTTVRTPEISCLEQLYGDRRTSSETKEAEVWPWHPGF